MIHNAATVMLLVIQIPGTSFKNKCVCVCASYFNCIMEASGSWRDRERTVWYYMRGCPPIGFVPINRQHVISECTTKNERIIRRLGFRIIGQCDLNTVMLREINTNRERLGRKGVWRVKNQRRI